MCAQLSQASYWSSVLQQLWSPCHAASVVDPAEASVLRAVPAACIAALLEVARSTDTCQPHADAISAQPWQPCTKEQTGLPAPLLPRSLSTALQAALLLLSMPHPAAICAAAPLTHPVAQRTSHVMHSMLSMLASLGPTPAAAADGTDAHKSAAAHECVTLTLWLRLLVAVLLRLLVAVLLPPLHAVAGEAQLWQRHQQDRRAAGLPPERSPAAPLYGAMLRLASSLDSLPHALVCSWGLLAISWNWARLLAPLIIAGAATS